MPRQAKNALTEVRRTCPDGRVFTQRGHASDSTSNNEITLWQTQSGQKVGTLLGHRNRIYALAFSPKNRVLASGSHDGTVKLWDWRAERLLADYKRHQGPVNAVVFSPDGRLLATASKDETAHILDMKSLLTPGKALKWKSEAALGLTLDGMKVVSE